MLTTPMVWYLLSGANLALTGPAITRPWERNQEMMSFPYPLCQERGRRFVTMRILVTMHDEAR